MNMSDQFPQGYFGPHHDLVMEVWRVAMSHLGFAQPVGSIPDGVVVVHTLELAQAILGYPRRGDEPVDWDDLLEGHRSEYISPSLDKRVDRVFASRTIDAFRAVQEHFIAMYADRPWIEQHVLYNIGAMFVDCAWARTELGRDSWFWEHVFACLRSGLIPINWDGRWQQGKLIVYVPPI